VFLYPKSVPRRFLHSRAEELCDEGWGPAHIIEIEIPDALAHLLEPDRSFWGYDDARAFRGTISAAAGCTITLVETIDPGQGGDR